MKYIRELKKLLFSLKYFKNPLGVYLKNSFLIYLSDIKLFLDRSVKKQKVKAITQSVFLKNGGFFKTFDYGGVFSLFHVWSEEYKLNPDSIKNYTTVVDIGAHIGLFSVFAGTVNRNCQIYAYEPETGNFNHLSENIQNCNLKNVHAFNVGVSDKTGYIDFYRGKDSSEFSCSKTLASYLTNNSENQLKPLEKIKVINFRYILESNKIEEIDFLKLDCEGAEFPILYSLGKDILERIKRISLEFHEYGEYSVNDLVEFLRSTGNYKEIEIKRTANKFGIVTCN